MQARRLSAADFLFREVGTDQFTPVDIDPTVDAPRLLPFSDEVIAAIPDNQESAVCVPRMGQRAIVAIV
jgi:hypothetical protein